MEDHSFASEPIGNQSPHVGELVAWWHQKKLKPVDLEVQPRNAAAVNSIRFLKLYKFGSVWHALRHRHEDPLPPFSPFFSSLLHQKSQVLVPQLLTKRRKNFFKSERPIRFIKTMDHVVQQTHCRIHPESELFLNDQTWPCSSFVPFEVEISKPPSKPPLTPLKHP